MNNAELVDIDCPLCASRKRRQLWQVKDYGRRISDQTFGLQRCMNCGVGYVSPRPGEKEIGKFYDPGFYWAYEGKQSLDAQSLLDARRPQLEAKAAVIAHLSPGSLLDIGAQKGDFLYYMAQRNWQVEGVEFSTLPPNVFSQDIRYGEFLDMDFGEKRYDCITMWAVLEHVWRPREYVQKATALLKPGGRLIVLVTNLNSIQGRYYRADDYPRHLTIFTRASLKRLYASVGLEVQRSWTDQRIFGGSLYGGLVYLGKRLAGYTADEVFYEWRNTDGSLFCAKYRGRPSWLIRNLSRVDRLLTWLPEKFLDWAGYGAILTVEAIKVRHE